MPSVGIGASVPFFRPPAPSGFDFQAFFAGRAGSVYLVGLPGYSTMYTTDVGSTEVVAQYDPVGRITDLSGNNNHWTQPVSGQRGSADTVYPRASLLLKSDPNANHYLECSVPALTDTAGYTMLVVGVANADMYGVNKCGMMRATSSLSVPSMGMEGVYSNAGGMRGVSWYYEQYIAGIHNPIAGHRILISEFQRKDRDTFRTIASNNIAGTTWTDAGDKAASRAYGYDLEFRTMGPDFASGQYYTVCHMVIEGFLSSDERTALYAFFASLDGLIV